MPLEEEENAETNAPLRRLTQVQRMIEEGMRSIEQENLVFLAYYDTLYEDDYNIQDRMDNLIVFKATHNPNTIYYH